MTQRARSVNPASEQDTPILTNWPWRICGGLAVALGAAVVLGWHTGIAAVVQVHRSFVPMQYNTALCFLLCGVGVLFFDRRPKLTTIFASLSALIGLLTLGEYLFDVELGLDQLFMRHYITVESSHPGRMAPNTALCFTITGAALLAAVGTKGRAVRAIGILACLLIVLGCVALIGYPSGLRQSYGWGGLTDMAVHTACGFVALGVGLFAAAWVHGLSEHNITAVTSMFGAGAAIVLWHVTALHSVLDQAMIGHDNCAMVERSMHGTIALVAIAGILGTGAVGLVIRQLRKNAALLEQRVANRTRECKQAEARVRLLLDSTAEAIYGLDLRGNCTFCNPACLQVLGYGDEADLLGRNMHDLIHHTHSDGTHYPMTQCRIYEAFQKGEGTHVDDEVLWRADGSRFSAEYWSYPVRQDGGVIGSVVTFLDITERKRIEEAVSESEERFRLTLDAVSDGGWDWNLATGEVRYSDRWLESLGYKRDGVSPDISFWESIVHPDDMPHVMEVLNAHFDGRTPYYQCECRLRTASGKYRWNLDRGRVVARDAAGKPLRMVGADADISERKRMEMDLRVSEQRFRAMFEQAAVGAAQIETATGRFMRINKKYSDIVGLTPEEMTATTFVEITHPDDLQADLDNIERLKQGDIREFTMEKRYFHKDGSVVWVNLTVSPMWAPGEKPNWHFAVV